MKPATTIDISIPKTGTKTGISAKILTIKALNPKQKTKKRGRIHTPENILFKKLKKDNFNSLLPK